MDSLFWTAKLAVDRIKVGTLWFRGTPTGYSYRLQLQVCCLKRNVVPPSSIKLQTQKSPHKSPTHPARERGDQSCPPAVAEKQRLGGHHRLAACSALTLCTRKKSTASGTSAGTRGPVPACPSERSQRPPWPEPPAPRRTLSTAARAASRLGTPAAAETARRPHDGPPRGHPR